MRGHSFLLLLSGLTLLLSITAIADEASGRTADGCTYKVINGQYLTSCPKRGQALAARDSVHSLSASPAAPVTSYDSVPLHRNYAAASPSLPPQQPSVSYGTAISSIERDNGAASDFDARNDLRRERLHAKLIDQTYAGLELGASNMKESNAGSATGFGVVLGTNVDDTFGFEFGYSYSKQDLSLGLAARGTSDLGTDPSLASSGASASIMGGGSATAPRSGTDSTLSSNLFRGEVLAHLTDSVKRLRPYLGAGLGWRSAKLQENAASTLYGGSQAGGSLHQNAFGALASAGTKLRIAKSVSLSFAFDYYLPLARQDARLEQPITAANAASPTSKLSSSDSFLTGSSQYQILGGVQYAF